MICIAHLRMITVQPHVHSRLWRSKTNFWRALTRLGAGVPVPHQLRRARTRGQTSHLAEPNHDPRRAYLAFACGVVRGLLRVFPML